MPAPVRAGAAVAGAVNRLPAASLAEVVDRAALQTCIDRKYLVSIDRFAELIARLTPGRRCRSTVNAGSRTSRCTSIPPTC